MTTQQPTAYSLFLTAWNSAPKIPFKMEWKNGTNYLDHATNDDELDIPYNEFRATIDDYGRYVLLKGLGLKCNIVVFERHVHGKSEVLVNNQPSHRHTKKVGLTNWVDIKDGALDLRNMEIFLNLRDNLLIINDAGIEYINKNVDPALVSTGDFEILINDCYTGVKQQDLQAFGISIQTLQIYGYIKDLV